MDIIYFPFTIFLKLRFADSYLFLFVRHVRRVSKPVFLKWGQTTKYLDHSQPQAVIKLRLNRLHARELKALEIPTCDQGRNRACPYSFWTKRILYSVSQAKLEHALSDSSSRWKLDLISMTVELIFNVNHPWSACDKWFCAKRATEVYYGFTDRVRRITGTSIAIPGS